MSALTTHFGWLPRSRLYGIFHHFEQVSSFRAAALRLGITPAHIHILEGAEGLRQLNRKGIGSTIVRLVRSLQGMTDEQGDIHRYSQALEQRRLVVMVDMPHDNARVKEDLRLAFEASDAQSVDYFGIFVNEHLAVGSVK